MATPVLPSLDVSAWPSVLVVEEPEGDVSQQLGPPLRGKIPDDERQRHGARPHHLAGQDAKSMAKTLK